jgi:hypothetical protein
MQETICPGALECGVGWRRVTPATDILHPHALDVSGAGLLHAQRTNVIYLFILENSLDTGSSLFPTCSNLFSKLCDDRCVHLLAHLHF